jgi:hypothetical protein
MIDGQNDQNQESFCPQIILPNSNFCAIAVLRESIEL